MFANEQWGFFFCFLVSLNMLGLMPYKCNPTKVLEVQSHSCLHSYFSMHQTNFKSTKLLIYFFYRIFVPCIYLTIFTRHQTQSPCHMYTIHSIRGKKQAKKDLVQITIIYFTFKFIYLLFFHTFLKLKNTTINNY